MIDRRLPPLDIVDDQSPVPFHCVDCGGMVDRRPAAAIPGQPARCATCQWIADNTGGSVAALLCCALGTVYRLLPRIAELYGSPEAFADACRTMIAKTAADDEEGS